jgi:hypothetical protein
MFQKKVCSVAGVLEGTQDEQSRDSSVGIALGYGSDDRGSMVRFPAGPRNFSLHHRIQNSYGAHSASYSMGTRGSFPRGKAAGAWNCSPPYSAEVKECVELYLHSNNTPSLSGAQSTGTNWPLPLPLPLLKMSSSLQSSFKWMVDKSKNKFVTVLS